MATGRDLQSAQIDAQAAYQAGDFRQAAALFASAAQDLQNQGDLQHAAEMRNNQSVACLQAGDGQAAWQACKGTDAIFAETGDLRRQAMALGNQAAALEKIGNWKTAIEKYEHAAGLLEQAGDKELRSVTLQSLSALQLKHRRQFDAMASMQASLAAKPKLTTRDHFLRRLMRLVFELLQRPPSV
jgi:tetratricopeptide (TPR) repeat protein